MIKLMYVTNDSQVAKAAEKAGVDRIFVDLEYKGKEERQKGLDTLKSHHCLSDISKIRKVIGESAELLVRINPIDDETENEINCAVEFGADIIMLPMWKKIEDVNKFIHYVNGRCRTMLLLETKEAVSCLDDVLKIKGIDEIHIGINDLSLSYHESNMFRVVSNGLVEKIINKIKKYNIPYGFGGFTKLSFGAVPAEFLIAEHYRVGSSMAILSKSFCNIAEMKNNGKNIEEYFSTEINKIRLFEKEVALFSQKDFEKNRDALCNKINLM